MSEHRSAPKRQSHSEVGGMGISLGNVFSGERATVSLGIDPGLNRTGYALIRRVNGRPVLIEGGVISSSRTASLEERVMEIGNGIRELLEEFQPDSAAIEQIFSMPRSPKAALMMAHARGAILYAIASRNCPLTHYSPKQVKRLLTGSGTASKEQIQYAIQRELGLPTILEPHDVADACAIALCHFHSLRVSSGTITERSLPVDFSAAGVSTLKRS